MDGGGGWWWLVSGQWWREEALCTPPLPHLFHEYGLEVVAVPSAFTLHGPFSPNSATSLEHPGPPVIHSTTGSVAGALRDSKNQ